MGRASNTQQFLYKKEKPYSGDLQMYYKLLGALITLFGIILLITGYSFSVLDGLSGKQAFLEYWKCWVIGGHIALYWVLHFLDL